MASQERLRGDQERRPPISRQASGERRQHRAVDWPEPGSPDLPTEDLQLVAEDEDLDVLGPVASRDVTEPSHETSEDGERDPAQHGRRMVPMPWSGRESEFWHPSRHGGPRRVPSSTRATPSRVAERFRTDAVVTVGRFSRSHDWAVEAASAGTDC